MTSQTRMSQRFSPTTIVVHIIHSFSVLSECEAGPIVISINTSNRGRSWTEIVSRIQPCKCRCRIYTGLNTVITVPADALVPGSARLSAGKRLTTRLYHYNDVIMSVMASQITSVSIVCLTACSGTDQGKYHSSASLAFVRGIHRWPVNSLHKCLYLMTSSWHIFFQVSVASYIT